MYGTLASRYIRFLPACSKFSNVSRSFHVCCSNSGFFNTPQEEGFLKRMAKKMGFTDTPKSMLKAAGYLMFIKIADEVDYKNFFKHCNLPDTFASWFTVMELHIWLLSARLMEDGDEGRLVRNSMIQAMWQDCDTRSKKLEGVLSSARKQQVGELNEQFQAAFFAYDEGLLGSDRILAGALWRRFLMDKAAPPKQGEELLKEIVATEMLVLYVRSHYYFLHNLSREQLLFKRAFKWASFDRSLFTEADKLRESKNS